MSVDKKSADKMPVDKISAGKMPVDRISVDEMVRQNAFRWNVYWQNDMLPVNNFKGQVDQFILKKLLQWQN